MDLATTGAATRGVTVTAGAAVMGGTAGVGVAAVARGVAVPGLAALGMVEPGTAATVVAPCAEAASALVESIAPDTIEARAPARKQWLEVSHFRFNAPERTGYPKITDSLTYKAVPSSVEM